MTIIAIGLAAIAAVRTYNRRMAEDPEGAKATVLRIRQSTSVILSVASGLWQILDALIGLFRPPTAAAPSSGGIRFGTQAASDAG